MSEPVLEIVPGADSETVKEFMRIAAHARTNGKGNAFADAARRVVALRMALETLYTYGGLGESTRTHLAAILREHNSPVVMGQ